MKQRKNGDTEQEALDKEIYNNAQILILCKDSKLSVNSNDVFKNIYNLGKELFNKYNGIIHSFFSSDYNLIRENIDLFLRKNNYPSIENNKHVDQLILEFYYDAIYCYLLKDYNDLLTKLSNVKNVNKIPSNLINRLNELEHILIDKLIFYHNTYKDNYLYNPSIEDKLFEESNALYIDEFNKDNINYKNPIYFKLFRNAMLIYMHDIKRERGILFDVNYKFIGYNNDTNHFNKVKYAYSIMGIAYYILYNQIGCCDEMVPCSNPECENLYEKNGNRKYCNTCCVKGIPARIRSKEWYSSEENRLHKKQIRKK